MLEHYAPERTADEWSAAMARALEGLPVEVVQSTSDQGRAIRCHVEKSLGAHHSPDLFHVQQDLVKGTAGALEAGVRQADKARLEALTESERLERQQALCDDPATQGRSLHGERELTRTQWAMASGGGGVGVGAGTGATNRSPGEHQDDQPSVSSL